MTDQERFDVAMTRVKSGETILNITNSLYQNHRQYRDACTPQQRAQLSAARREYRYAQKQNEARTSRPVPPRFILDTTTERHQAVHEHCRTMGLSVARFCNSAIAEALARVKK